MGAEQKTHFKVDRSKCIQCGKCVNTCSGMVITFGKDGYPEKKIHRYTDGKNASATPSALQELL